MGASAPIFRLGNMEMNNSENLVQSFGKIWETHPTFYAILFASLITLSGAAIAIIGITKSRQSAREKNSIDFEKDYKGSEAVERHWMVFRDSIRRSDAETIRQYFINRDTDEFKALVGILNEWERAANGIAHDIYDGRFLYQAYGTTFLDLFVICKPFIDAAQDKNARTFRAITQLFIDWKIFRQLEDSGSCDEELRKIYSKLASLMS